MMHRLETRATMDSASWTWHVIPLLIVAAALSVVLLFLTLRRAWNQKPKS